MGRTKTYVGTSVSRAIEDKHIPDSVKKGMLAAILGNSGIVDNILEELVGSIGVRTNRLYDFAKNGNYIHGLPSGQFTLPSSELKDVVKQVLEGVHGVAGVVVDYVHTGQPNNLHGGWIALLRDHGYNPVTNQLAVLSAQKGVPVYLHDMVVVVPAADLDKQSPFTLQQWGIAPCAGETPERPVKDPSMTALIQHTPVQAVEGAVEHLRVEYVWRVGTNPIQRDSFTIPVAGFDLDRDYIQARYRINDQVHYVSYQLGSGVHQSLERLYDKEPDSAGRFFPFIYFRWKKVNEASNKESESYKDGKKLAKLLGMEFDEVADAIDKNPDIKDVEQAVLMFAASANTQDEYEQRYLFEFFYQLYMAQEPKNRFTSEEQAAIAQRLGGNRSWEPPGIVIQDRRFKMSLTNNGIFKIYKKGNIGKPGTHESGVVKAGSAHWVQDAVTKQMVSVVSPKTYHTYRRQVTADLIEEIQVVDLKTQFHIFDSYSTIGDEEDAILLIPIDRSITEDWSLPDQEKLYSRSLHYVFNSVTTVKLKWYQTGVFKAIMLIIAIVITIFTYGSDGGSTIYAALAAGAYTVAVQLIVMAIIQFVVVQAAFKLFAKAVGAKAAFIVAVIAAMYGIYDAMDAGSLANAPFAQELLSVSSNLVMAANGQIALDTQDLIKEYSALEKEYEEQMKLIERAQELLDTNHHLNPFILIGEKPEDFYNRTVHSGNIGVVGIEAISSFVDMKLTLPKLSETLGVGTGGQYE